MKKPKPGREEDAGFKLLSQDDFIPTTDVGVKNTEHGHCAKTFAILRLVIERSWTIPNLLWVVLADDDTLLSIPRLQDFLSCWNYTKPIVIGERYGYNVQKDKPGGYNYITGGGGIVMSIPTLEAVLEHFSCDSADAPDDMFLAICLAKLNIPVVHSPDFHQARPDDYAYGYLAAQRPISFHKHWMIDPISTYKKWLEDVNDRHEEL